MLLFAVLEISLVVTGGVSQLKRGKWGRDGGRGWGSVGGGSR